MQCIWGSGVAQGSFRKEMDKVVETPMMVFASLCEKFSDAYGDFRALQ